MEAATYNAVWHSERIEVVKLQFDVPLSNHQNASGLLSPLMYKFEQLETTLKKTEEPSLRHAQKWANDALTKSYLKQKNYFKS